MASNTIDIGLSEGDLMIEGGDFVLTNAQQRHIEHILISAQGNWRFYPELGVNVQSYVNAPMSPQGITAIKRRIRLHLELDGWRMNGLEIGGEGSINVNAEKVK